MSFSAVVGHGCSAHMSWWEIQTVCRPECGRTASGTCGLSVSLTARCWRSDFSLVWLNFVTYKLGIMLPYLWRVLWSSAVIVPTLQNSITMIMNFPFLLGHFDLNRPMLWMHLCIFLCSSTPVFPHQVAGEERSRWELWSPLRWCPWAPISPLPAVGGWAYGWWWAGSRCTD